LAEHFESEVKNMAGFFLKLFHFFEKKTAKSGFSDECSKAATGP
jgi:hypothetical protein